MNDKDDGIKLVSVYKAPDEFMARTVESLLKKNGIEMFLKSNQIPMYDSIGTLMKGNWGEILVRNSDVNRAEDLINGFLSEKDE